jgi:cation transport ATPase
MNNTEIKLRQGVRPKVIKSVSVPAGSAAIYTCPMHPEVKQKGPGSCPICGMDLVPEMPQKNDEEEIAYQKMAKKFRIALILTVPVFIISMSDMISFINLDSVVSMKFWIWLAFILTTPVVFYSGGLFFKRGWSSIRRYRSWCRLFIQCAWITFPRHVSGPVQRYPWECSSLF